MRVAGGWAYVKRLGEPIYLGAPVDVSVVAEPWLVRRIEGASHLNRTGIFGVHQPERLVAVAVDSGKQNMGGVGGPHRLLIAVEGIVGELFRRARPRHGGNPDTALFKQPPGWFATSDGSGGGRTGSGCEGDPVPAGRPGWADRGGAVVSQKREGRSVQVDDRNALLCPLVASDSGGDCQAGSIRRQREHVVVNQHGYTHGARGSAVRRNAKQLQPVGHQGRGEIGILPEKDLLAIAAPHAREQSRILGYEHLGFTLRLVQRKTAEAAGAPLDAADGVAVNDLIALRAEHNGKGRVLDGSRCLAPTVGGSEDLQTGGASDEEFIAAWEPPGAGGNG